MVDVFQFKIPMFFQSVIKPLLVTVLRLLKFHFFHLKYLNCLDMFNPANISALIFHLFWWSGFLKPHRAVRPLPTLVDHLIYLPYTKRCSIGQPPPRLPRRPLSCPPFHVTPVTCAL